MPIMPSLAIFLTVSGETLFLVHFLSQRLDLVLSKAAIHLLDEEFFFRQIKNPCDWFLLSNLFVYGKPYKVKS